MRSRGRGFSLIEVTVAVGLLLLVLVFLSQAFMGLRQSKNVVRAQAEDLAETMRALRQQSMTSHTPTGIGIPSAGGPASGYYVLQGEVRPRVVRTRSFNEGQSLVLAGCCWSELGFTSSPASSFLSSRYSLANWQPPQPNDGLVMFLPSGEILTNLPTYQGQVALVLARGLEVQPGALGLELLRAKNPLVLWCSLLGEIRLEGSLAGASHRLSDGLNASPISGVPGVDRSPANGPPEFTGPVLQISPPANANTLGQVAPGSTSTLRLQRYVSLKVTARDPDGDPLWCRWIPRSSSPGQAFTKSGEVKMHYNPEARHWEATWAWHSPPGAAANSEFELDAVVSDHRGGEARLAGQIAGSGRFHLLTPGYLAFSRGNDTWMSNWDGSDPVIVVRNRTRPRWSRGADRLVVKENSPGGHLWVVSRDGRRLDQLTNLPAQWTSPGSWSASNRRIGFAQQNGNSCSVHSVSPWGLNDDLLNWGGGALNYPAGTQPGVDFHPANDLMIVSPDTPGTMYLVSRTAAFPLGVSGAEASFNATGSHLIYRTGAGQVAVAPLTLAFDDAVPSALSGSLQPSQWNASGNLGSPKLSADASMNYAVVHAPDGGRFNCFLMLNQLQTRLPLFDFQQDCRDPDWSD